MPAPRRPEEVLDVSRPLQTTPGWRRIATSWILAILVAQLAGILMFVLSLMVAVPVRGLVEVARWLGRLFV